MQYVWEWQLKQLYILLLHRVQTCSKMQEEVRAYQKFRMVKNELPKCFWILNNLQEYFLQLSNAPYKEMIEISEGTHTIIMEKNRMLMFKAVQLFLDTNFQPER